MAEGHSIEECLLDYPEQREQLHTLLEAAQTTLGAAASLAPPESARARAKERLLERIEAGELTDECPRWRRIVGRRIVGRRMAGRRMAIPMAAVLVLMTVVLGGGSIAAVAADDTLPGDSLYWVKRTKENVLLTFSRGDTGKAQAHAELAGVRAEEMRGLIEQGRIAAAEKHLDAVRRHLRASAEYAGVEVTLDRLEMPSAGTSIERPNELVTLVVTLKRDGDLLRIRPVLVDGSGLQDHRQRIEQIRRDFELSYWVLVSALYPDATSGPFWRTETIGAQPSR